MIPGHAAADPRAEDRKVDGRLRVAGCEAPDQSVHIAKIEILHPGGGAEGATLRRRGGQAVAVTAPQDEEGARPRIGASQGRTEAAGRACNQNRSVGHNSAA